MYKFDPEYEKHEEEWRAIKIEILGEDLANGAQVLASEPVKESHLEEEAKQIITDETD